MFPLLFLLIHSFSVFFSFFILLCCSFFFSFPFPSFFIICQISRNTFPFHPFHPSLGVFSEDLRCIVERPGAKHRTVNKYVPIVSSPCLAAQRESITCKSETETSCCLGASDLLWISRTGNEVPSVAAALLEPLERGQSKFVSELVCFHFDNVTVSLKANWCLAQDKHKSQCMWWKAETSLSQQPLRHVFDCWNRTQMSDLPRGDLMTEAHGTAIFRAVFETFSRVARMLVCQGRDSFSQRRVQGLQEAIDTSDITWLHTVRNRLGGVRRRL